jgi:uncharacterized protein (TIGR02611 family)
MTAPNDTTTFVDRLKAVRARIRSTRAGKLVYQAVVVVVGVAVILIGIVLLPLPGPGWLIIFAGLGILATEFTWAARLLLYARAKVAAWVAWAGRQGRPVQALLGLGGLIFIGALIAASWWVYTR